MPELYMFMFSNSFLIALGGIPSNYLEKAGRNNSTLSPGLQKHPLIHPLLHNHYYYTAKKSIGLETK